MLTLLASFCDFHHTQNLIVRHVLTILPNKKKTALVNLDGAPIKSLRLDICRGSEANEISERLQVPLDAQTIRQRKFVCQLAILGRGRRGHKSVQAAISRI